LINETLEIPERFPPVRAMAERRMLERTRSLTEDVTPLLPAGIRSGEADAIQTLERVWIDLIARIVGEAWKLTGRYSRSCA
jgi:hypothetical protein